MPKLRSMHCSNTEEDVQKACRFPAPGLPLWSPAAAAAQAERGLGYAWLFSALAAASSLFILSNKEQIRAVGGVLGSILLAGLLVIHHIPSKDVRRLSTARL